VGTITLGLTAEAVHLQIGIPGVLAFHRTTDATLTRVASTRPVAQAMVIRT
jgi:hypothetical protein